MMKALSIRQPWAWLIVNGWKDIENRVWHTDLRGRIYVHSGKKVDNEGAIWLWEHREAFGIQGCMKEWVDICNLWDGGALVGEVDIIDCVTRSDSLWFTGQYGFVLANPVAYSEPIPCKGRQGFWEGLTDAHRA